MKLSAKNSISAIFCKIVEYTIYLRAIIAAVEAAGKVLASNDVIEENKTNLD